MFTIEIVLYFVKFKIIWLIYIFITNISLTDPFLRNDLWFTNFTYTKLKAYRYAIITIFTVYFAYFFDYKLSIYLNKLYGSVDTCRLYADNNAYYENNENTFKEIILNSMAYFQ